MNTLREMLIGGEPDDKVIQLAIRDIDTRTFIECLCGMAGDEREVLYRNLSARAREAVAADLLEREATIRPDEMADAVSAFARLLSKHARWERRGVPSAPAYDPAAVTPAALADNFLHVSAMVRAGEYGRLAELSEEDPDRLMREGLRMLVDGIDPLQARGRLERLRSALLAHQARRMDLILEGFDSVMGGDRPGLTAEKLAALAADA